jgi:AraC-like DNA-binding protein
MDVLERGRALTNSPQMSFNRPEPCEFMDPLADVFTSMRVQSVVHGRLEATAPWALSFDAPAQAKFGIVLRGSCWLTVAGEASPVPLTSGDCYLLPRGMEHELSDDPSTPSRKFSDVVDRSHEVMEYGGGGTATTIIGGRFIFDVPSSAPLTSLLPSVIHIRATGEQALGLQMTVKLLAAELEAPGAGSQVIVSRLAETLFVQAIRAHVACSGCKTTGWLRAMTDPSIGAAMKAMHDQIADPWTVASLASAAGMSRSAFAARFKELVGEPPLEYLTRWRMYQAGRMLRGGSGKLLDVARMVGYDSDGAFNKAFKRILDVTPGDYRRGVGD